MTRSIDANALQKRLERKKPGIANQSYTEGWNDCLMRVKSMVSTAPTLENRKGGTDMTTQELQQILRSLDKLNENLLRIARALETLPTR
jgi:hypothetical protein